MNNDEFSSLEYRIAKLYLKISTILNKFDDNLNKLKKELSTLTKKYENNKSISLNKDLKNQNINFYEFDLKLKELLSNERETNIKYINENFLKYTNDEILKNNSKKIKNTNTILNIEEEISNCFGDINTKVSLLINNRDNTIEKMINEMNKEFNIIHKLIIDNNLDLIGSNSDKADAIQDMLKIFLTKFKNEKKEKSNFEEKITKLIEELLDKMILMKNNPNN